MAKEDLHLINVKALKVNEGIGLSTGTVHTIFYNFNKKGLNLIPYNNSDLKEIILRITNEKPENLNLFLDTGVKASESCASFESLGLSIGIGLKTNINRWKSEWKSQWSKWCFTGKIKNNHGEIENVLGIKSKIEGAISDKDVEHIMVPEGNRAEIDDWLDENGIIKSEEPQRKDNTTPLFPKIRSLLNKNIVTKILFALWIFSIIYIPVRYFLWDQVLSWKSNTKIATIGLPSTDYDNVKNRLSERGFPEDQIKKLGSPYLNITSNKSHNIRFKLDNGNITIEMINIHDGSMIAAYICGGYILIFAILILVISIMANKDIIYDSLVLFHENNKKVIMFVNNLTNAETIVRHRLSTPAKAPQE